MPAPLGGVGTVGRRREVWGGGWVVGEGRGGGGGSVACGPQWAGRGPSIIRLHLRVGRQWGGRWGWRGQFT